MTSAAPLRPKNAPARSEARRAPAERFAASPAPQQLSASVRLGGTHDAEEHEAETAAAAISAGGVHRVSDSGGAGHLRSHPGPKLLDPGAAGRIRSTPAEKLLDPGASGQVRRLTSFDALWARDPAKAAARVEQARYSSSRPLPETVRTRLEHGFGQTLHSVRVHTGPSARAAASAIGARAYTEGERITLGHGESEHDLGLMAHETTHVIQNRRAAGVFRPMHEAPAAETARRAVTATPEQGPLRPMIRRSIISRALDWLADKANYIPGFRLLTVALGFNPINGATVERSGANILRAAISIIPLGELIVQALEQYNAFDKAGAFVDKQLKVLGDLGSSLKRALHEFLDSLGWTDVFHPGEVLERGLRIFSDPAVKLIDFLKGLGEGLIEFVRDAVLRPIAALVAKRPAWDILVGVFGKNPITGEPVESAAETVIGGLLKLAKQDEIFENMKKAHALSRIGAWFKSAVSELFGFVKQIPSLFIKVLKSFGIRDLLHLPSAIGRVIGIFGDFVLKFVGWVGKTMWTILEIIFDVVSPTALSYIKKTGAALKSILKNPLPFVRHLVAAAKLGFNTFADNFGDHLKAALLCWLTGPLRGVYIPKAFSLIEFGKFALSVLEVSWAQIRGKIVQALGPTGETIMATLEKTFDVVTKLAQGGISAVWDLIKDNLANLKETLIDGIVGFVKGTIITKAVPKLLSLFIPGAGFISAIISIYDTIKVFIEKLSTMGRVALAFIDSLVSIAGGLIQSAAKRVEIALAGLISLAISFLAGFAQLGDIPEKVKDVIKKVKDPVDKAVGAAVNWIIGKAKAAFAWLFGKGDKDGKGSEGEALRSAVAEVTQQMEKKDATVTSVQTILPTIQAKYKLTGLSLVKDKEDRYHIKATINPTLEGPSGILFTPEELVALDQVAKQYAAKINEKSKKDPAFKVNAMADLDGFIKSGGRVTTGAMVEAMGAVAIEGVAKEANLTVIKGAYLQWIDVSGRIIGGKGPELDFLIVGSKGVQEVVSAKFKEGSVKVAVDKKHLGAFHNIPLGGPALIAYVQSNYGINKDFVNIASANVVSNLGTMALGQFRDTYLGKIPVDEIEITGLTPGPEEPSGLQLRVTRDELVKKTAELMKKYL